ncbi:type I pantothenate kinase [Lactococcus formosensis]|jgi:pantothenate kinase, bacterial type|uniref:Pantothenate kinase n=2 Tax=Lactococcus formosensis TaxID=1281486 RepID=A0A9X4P8M6_9LACT|nr:type I pantothenate kinase [Lactococcus formosensis]NHI73497.1 type I pantothenate kinase [Lactococcus garvieae]MCH1722083.1 type I pantothenate kinase [Lactococcus formosensis]MCO7180073.1 type I pantothenate kinase [Lactococcus formosensis]MDG6113808.1 type I pantothenate kinase [Lactococcus formosensis]MDG6115789.1 type I pantothenate kinase [Lactococcus formosensis]
MNKFINYDEISRETWQNLYLSSIVPLTNKELDAIRSLNDEISLQDVIDVYLPLIYLVRLYKKNIEDLSFSKGLFLQKIVKTPPLIIGISGSVAVGKSTAARLVQLLLSREFKKLSVELVTTDGFLYPTAVLEERNMLDRKGFPESYDMEHLLNFLYRVKNGETCEIPIYSHENYDILKDQTQTIDQPDILIVEGINVLQNPQSEHLYVSDFYDFSIYVDADEAVIERWYLERFDSLLKLAEDNPHNYYHQFTKMPYDEVMKLARQTWANTNLPNLRDYIEPTRNRAEVILHKTDNHYIDKIYLKKF